MKPVIRHALLSSLALGLVIPLNSYATNGYFLIGFGAKSRAMGGTGVAYNMGGMASAFNPASMIESSNSAELGAEFFRPKMGIYHDSGLMGITNEGSNHDKFIIPSMGVTYKWNDKVTVGAAMIGAGMKTEFNQTTNNNACTNERTKPLADQQACPPTVFNILNDLASNEAGVELYQVQMLPSIAYRLDKKHTVGATFVIAGQYFRAEGLEDFGAAGFTAAGTISSGTPEENLASSRLGLTGVGFSHAFGVGYRVGWLSSLYDDKLKIGINYSARVDMNKFSRYSQLFAEQGDFDIPENYTLGIAYKFTPDLVASFDIQRIAYADVKSIGNPGPNAAVPSDLNPLCPGADTLDCKLGGENGMGFGWTDMKIYKVGVDWKYNEKISFRGGFNYGEAPIKNDQVLFNLLAPATVEKHFTIGAEYKFNKDYELSVNYMHAFRNTITGPTAFGVGGATVTGSNAAISMYQDTLGATLAIKF